MRKVYSGDFRVYVYRHITEINAQMPEHQSIEWFFMRYLRRIGKHANPPANRNKLAGTMRGLLRFYVDMIDENSALADRFAKIYTEYRKTLCSYSTSDSQADS